MPALSILCKNREIRNYLIIAVFNGRGDRWLPMERALSQNFSHRAHHAYHIIVVYCFCKYLISATIISGEVTTVLCLDRDSCFHLWHAGKRQREDCSRHNSCIHNRSASASATMASVAPTSLSLQEQHTAATVQEETPSLWAMLLQRLDPRACMASFEGDLPLEEAVPMIRSNLLLEPERKKALRQLYDLTAPKRWEYR